MTKIDDAMAAAIERVSLNNRADTMIETVLRRAFLAAAIKAYPATLRLYARNVGVFRLEGGRYFHAGIKGQSDIWGYYRGKDGITRPIEIELKRPRTPTTKDQDMWEAHCKQWNITYMKLTEIKDEPDVVGRFVKELGVAIAA